MSPEEVFQPRLFNLTLTNLKLIVKTKLYHLILPLALFCAFNSPFTNVFAQGTAFTYQGQLFNGGNPVNGSYDLRFAVWSAASGGTVVGGPVTNTAVVVSNGLFTTIIDFGSGVFNGPTNWLHIQVATNGSGAFASLSPRQELTPTPYAIYAEGADAAGLSGTLASSSLPASPNFSGTVTAAGFAGNGSGLLAVDASLLGGLPATSFWQTTGNVGTTAGVNFVGTTDDQALDLDSYGNRGLQLQYVSRSTAFPFLSSTTGMNVLGGYWGNSISANVIGATIGGGGEAFRFGLDSFGSSPNVVTNDFGTVGGGYGNTAGYAGTVPGGYENTASGSGSFAAGAYASATYNDSFVWSDGSSTTFSDTGPNQFQILASGGVGIGTLNAPQQYLSVRGGMNLDQANLNGGVLNNGNTNGYGLSFGSGSGEGIASERIAGANQYGLDFYTSFLQRMSLNNSGNLMLNGNDLWLEDDNSYNGMGYRTSVAGLTPSGGDGIFIYGYDAGYLGTRDPDSVALYWDWHNNVTVTGEYFVVDGLTPVDAYIGDDGSGNDVQIGSQKSGVTALAAFNTADNAYMHFYCSSITIEGGADLAEPFKITQADQPVEEGEVVVIDDAHPGQLKLTDQPYDTRVAGVVSGANGINPGIQMHQQGLLEGGKNVALTGRVYVKADASNGPIKPGDLLTTSSTPGRAMRVSDHLRAQGAILGKAMTALNEGEGMVLVLVTLQ